MIDLNRTAAPARPRPSRHRLAMIAGCAAALGLAVLYGTNGGWSNAASAESCAAAKPLAAAMQPLARGEVAAVQVANDPKLVPTLAFTGPDGTPMTVADLRGKTVLLNLWATWCVPCRQEMPALDALQGQLGGPNFQVVAVNIDTRNPERPKLWLAEAGVNRLDYFADPAARTFQVLKAAGKAFGMPTTLIINPEGCELASLAGPVDWGSADASALIKAALGRSIMVGKPVSR